MKNKRIPIHSLTQHCDDKIPAYFKVSSFDAMACTVAEFQENHRHEHYEIVWLKRGNGVHLIDGHSYAYNGAVLFLLSPGQVHRLDQREKAEGYVLKFLPDIFSDPKDADKYLLHSGLFDNIEAEPVLKPTASLCPVLEELFERMSREYNTDESGRDDIVRAYLQILLTHIQRLKTRPYQRSGHIPDAGQELFRRYKVAIEQNYRQQHAVGFYADLLYVQPRTLNSLCRKFANRSAGQLIDDRVLLEARRYLHHDTASMKEIAYALGFEDPAYFNRFFKKHAGIAPQQYRMQETGGAPRATALAG